MHESHIITNTIYALNKSVSCSIFQFQFVVKDYLCRHEWHGNNPKTTFSRHCFDKIMTIGTVWQCGLFVFQEQTVKKEKKWNNFQFTWKSYKNMYLVGGHKTTGKLQLNLDITVRTE